ncbi:hypothetical protein ACFPMF_13095 [Larkinella bovis]|uniref:Uncharacterized protein n=1 Tax=Larkinella bovis TaxID=683041 RepID=A0ABW0ICI8_9BACT
MSSRRPKKTSVRPERVMSGEENRKKFAPNALRLNGFPLDYGWFSIQSRGKLSIVEGDADENQTARIPIRVYLKRGKTIVTPDRAGGCQGATEVDLAEIMSLARAGDELVVEPVRKEDAMAKRVIFLKLFWFLPNKNVKGPGC